MHRLAAAILALTVTQEGAPPPAAEAAPTPAAQVAPSRAAPTIPATAPNALGGPAPAPPGAPAAPRPRAPAPPPSRELLLRAALAFADALVRGDAVALAEASASRFSFDGAAVDGREAQIRRWREILASRRAGSPDVLRDLILLTGEEAAAQLGPPPPRIEGWARPEAWLAVADVSGRPVVLLLATDGGRWAVAGMTD